MRRRLPDPATRTAEGTAIWTPEKIRETVASQKTVQANFPKPLPVYIVYMSSAALQDGTIKDYADIYKKDGKVIAALNDVVVPKKAAAGRQAEGQGREPLALAAAFELPRLHSGSTTSARPSSLARYRWRAPIRPLRTSILIADRRLYPRVEVALPAFLQADGERHFVQLLDVSPGGAKLNCAASLSTGTAVVLDCGTLGRASGCPVAERRDCWVSVSTASWAPGRFQP